MFVPTGPVALCFANAGAIFYALFTFSITYGTNHIGLSRDTMLLVAVACSAVAFFGLPVAGSLSDRYGRKAVFTTGIVLTVVVAFPMFWLIDRRSVLLTLTGYLPTRS
ncbi:MFS family permease [Rhodococcus sp. 27YEA15]|uniref:MFS transporter n=1 Tax=Rhodococcus sp. 27YEA15 TaxID=3156259 RepID=UPI003C7C9D17